MSTQKQRMREAAERLSYNIGDTAALERLDDAMADAQNQPEHGGKADGSVDEAYWNNAREYRKAIKLACDSLRRMLKP